MRSRHAIAAVAGLAALLALSSAGAGTFTISPLRVDFTGATGTAALTVRNEEAAPVVVQAEGLAWSQESGQDALGPTRDLLVSPAVFTLAPGGSQLVRVALRRGPDATRELAYRMVLQEVPQAASPDFNGLQVALRLSIPVFIAPIAPAAPDLEWTGRTGTDGRATLVARNAGAANARIHNFVLKATDGRTLFEQPGLAYVLAGASREWIIDTKNKNEPAQGNAAVAIGPGTYRLEGTTDRGAFAAGLKVAAD
jgi:fimbrial chaperone protein